MNAVFLPESGSKSEFYPTPKSLIEKMLSGIDWRGIYTILEPSAGKGDILKSIAQKENYNRSFDVDAIEIDPHLRQILKCEFAQKKIKTSRYETSDTFEDGLHIVHDDFLTYNAFKKYDLIVMNPPFSNGDQHLLKAIQIQKYGGKIVCLLNAETIKNPYTPTRKTLLEKLTEYNADIEYIQGAFLQSERKTGVEIALIKIDIPVIEEESEIYSRLKEAEAAEEFDPSVTDIAVTDFIKYIVSQYTVEVKAGIELIRQYRAMIPYMRKEMDNKSGPILRLTDSADRGYDSVSINSYLTKVRLKYWKALLQNPKFVGRLTSKLQEKYFKRVEQLADYDFSEFNIKTLVAEINAEVKEGIESEAVEMFDRLTAEHSWYPECAKNVHYYNGWRTNEAHKIGKKVILPCYGVFSSWSGRPDVHNAGKTLSDIERVLNFFDGNMTENVTMWDAIKEKFDEGITKNIHLKFFDVTFYKKGTVHITFNCPELIERYNIYIARNKNWLPPCYGRKNYTDMDQQEKDIIDSFQGEKEYQKVMDKPTYFLSPITGNSVLMLKG